jgi:flagellar motor protein MotB
MDPAEYADPKDFLLARSQLEVRRLEVENLQLLEDKQRLLEEVEARLEETSELQSALVVAKKQTAAVGASMRERNGAMRQRLETLEEEQALHDEQLRELVELEKVKVRTRRMHDQNVSIRADVVHMRADNARLLQLLSSTQEYQQLMTMIEASGHSTFVPSDDLGGEDVNGNGIAGEAHDSAHMWPSWPAGNSSGKDVQSKTYNNSATHEIQDTHATTQQQHQQAMKRIQTTVMERLKEEDIEHVDVDLVHSRIHLGDPIGFHPKSAKVTKGALDILEELTIACTTIHETVHELGFPEIHLRVEGHVSKTKDVERCSELSTARAEKICACIVASGTPTRTLHAKGYGASRPIGAAEENRRIEVHVLTEEEVHAAIGGGAYEEREVQWLQQRRRERRVLATKNARRALEDTESMRQLYHGASPLGIRVFDLVPLAADPALEGTLS